MIPFRLGPRARANLVIAAVIAAIIGAVVLIAVFPAAGPAIAGLVVIAGFLLVVIGILWVISEELTDVFKERDKRRNRR